MKRPPTFRAAWLLAAERHPMNCDSKRHLASAVYPAPAAVAEWLDPVEGRWRPICAGCLDVVKHSYARQREKFTDPIALAAFDATMQIREVQP